MAEIRPAAEWMVKALYGRTLPRTVEAIAVLEGKRVLGLTGFYPDGGRLKLFAHIDERARAELPRHTRVLLRAARQILRRAGCWHIPVWAWCDTRYPRAEAVLEHLAFKKTEHKDIWEWATTSA
jgi:hypothetical protein